MAYINTPLTKLGNSSSEIVTLDKIFPVGSIYLGTTEVCPMQILMEDSVWEKVSQDRVLQGAGTRGSVGTTLEESLPNIEGNIYFRSTTLSGENSSDLILNNSSIDNTSLGSFIRGLYNIPWADNGNHSLLKITTSSETKKGYVQKLGFNASNSSSTYQDNAPVQQAAYLINVWRRIA